jgi:hypothetical protein
MTFREQLNKANELKINICDLIIANELDCILDFEYTESQFEKLCSLAREVYLKSEYVSENAIAHAINDLITCDNKTVKQVLCMDVWELVDKATCYC